MYRNYFWGLTFLFFFVNTLVACTNYNEEELYPAATSDEECKIEVVSYQTDIQPIMQRACINCHASNFASDAIILDTHEGVKNSAINRASLLPSIKHAPGFTVMPLFGTKLPACDIAKIEAWVKAGAPNN